MYSMALSFAYFESYTYSEPDGYCEMERFRYLYSSAIPYPAAKLATILSITQFCAVKNKPLLARVYLMLINKENEIILPLGW